MPGLPVHHQLPGLPKLMSTELVMPSNHLILMLSPSWAGGPLLAPVEKSTVLNKPAPQSVTWAMPDSTKSRAARTIHSRLGFLHHLGSRTCTAIVTRKNKCFGISYNLINVCETTLSYRNDIDTLSCDPTSCQEGVSLGFLDAWCHAV